MLVLAHADGHGIDLHQFRQRVLQAAGDGDRRSQIDVVIRKFLRRQLAGRIDGGAGLVHHGVAELQGFARARKQPYHLDRHGLRFAAGRSIADGQVPDAAAPRHGAQRADGVLLSRFAERGIDDRGIQHLAGLVHHGDLAAVAVARVQPHDDGALHRRLHQQRLQVEREVVDGSFVRGLRQLGAQFSLQGRPDQPVVGVVAGGAQKRLSRALPRNDPPGQQALRLFLVRFQGHFQEAFLFAPVDRQGLMARHLRVGLVEIVIGAVDGIFFLRRPRAHGDAALQMLLQRLAVVRVVGFDLRDDVRRAGEGVFDRSHAFLRVHVLRGQSLGRVLALQQDLEGQGFQSLFLRDGRAGALLLLVRPVQVFQFGLGGGRFDGGPQFVRQLALLFDGVQHRFLALVQVAQIRQPFRQRAQLCVVHGAVQLLAVAGDERDRVAFVDQLHHVRHVLRRRANFFGDRVYDHQIFPAVRFCHKLLFSCFDSALLYHVSRDKRTVLGTAQNRKTFLFLARRNRFMSTVKPMFAENYPQVFPS